MIIISRLSFLDAIKAVAPAVKKSSMPALECVRIEVQSGKIRTDGSHLDMGLAYSQHVGTRTKDFQMLIPLRPLIDILPTLVEDDVELTIDEEHWRVTMKCGPTKTVLPLHNTSDYPDITEFPVFASNMVDSSRIKSGLFAASINEAQPVLTCAFLEGKDYVLKVVTTDAVRISIVKTQYEGDDFKALCPASSLIYATNWGGVNIKVKDNGQVLIFDPARMLIANQVQGNFPDFERIIPQGFSGILKVSGITLATALKQLLPVAKGGDFAQVDLDANADGLKLSTVTETGEFETQIKAEVTGQIKFRMNAALLLQGVQSRADNLTIEWTDAMKPIAIRSCSDQNWLYIQMPVHRQ